MDECLNVEQVAKKLNIHIMTVYKLISSGRLQAIRMPGIGLRIEAKELKKLLSQNTRRTRTRSKRRTSAKPRK